MSRTALSKVTSYWSLLPRASKYNHPPPLHSKTYLDLNYFTLPYLTLPYPTLDNGNTRPANKSWLVLLT